jgi:hypothetical protein
VDKATCAAIVRAYEVDRGDVEVESGAREGGEYGGEGRGGGGWISGLSAAAPEVALDAESRSADRESQAAERTSQRRKQ